MDLLNEIEITTYRASESAQIKELRDSAIYHFGEWIVNRRTAPSLNFFSFHFTPKFLQVLDVKNKVIVKYERGTSHRIMAIMADIREYLKPYIEIQRERVLTEADKNERREQVQKVLDTYFDTDCELETDGDTITLSTDRNTRLVIRRNGEINRLQFDYGRDCGTLEHLAELQKQYEPIEKRLTELAEKVKNEIPQDWFEETK